MRRSGNLILRYLHQYRNFCTSALPSSSDKIVAAVVFERLPLVVPKIHPTYYAFQQFSYRWGKMSVKKKEREKGKGKEKEKETEQTKQPGSLLEKLETMSKGDFDIEYKRVPWNGNADESNNRRSPFRALDRRLYLLVHGCPLGSPSKKPVWHFPEKEYESERTLRQCGQAALKAVIGDISHAYFVANAPLAHLAIQQTEGTPDAQSFKKFFFKSHVVGLNKFQVENCEDYVWVTRDELIEYFPEEAAFFKKMIIS